MPSSDWTEAINIQHSFVLTKFRCCLAMAIVARLVIKLSIKLFQLNPVGSGCTLFNIFSFTSNHMQSKFFGGHLFLPCIQPNLQYYHFRAGRFVCIQQCSFEHWTLLAIKNYFTHSLVACMHSPIPHAQNSVSWKGNTLVDR